MSLTIIRTLVSDFETVSGLGAGTLITREIPFWTAFCLDFCSNVGRSIMLEPSPSGQVEHHNGASSVRGDSLRLTGRELFKCLLYISCF